MQIEELLFFHETLNRLCFCGQLEAVIMKSTSLRGNVQARFVGETEPFLMDFDADTLKEAETAEDKIYIITMLLHEMIHQYSREKGIEDTTDDGEHLPAFQQIAEEHGMIRAGYGLSEPLKTKLLELMKGYAAVNNISF